MLKFAVLCLIAVCAANAADDKMPMKPKWKSPAFCKGLACPMYIVLNKTKDYEIRHYAPATWVSTNTTGTDYKMAGSMMFRKLFNYIDGMNSKSMKIPMTTPVFRSVMPGQGPTCASTFTEHFYIPSKMAANAPLPRDPTVYLSMYPDSVMYVRSFAGFAYDETRFVEQGLELAKAIGDNSLYHTTHWYTAVYDGPYTFFNRRNEIMFEKMPDM